MFFDQEATCQHESEFRDALGVITGVGPLDTVVEIGTKLGGTALCFAQVASKKVVCIDLDFNQGGQPPVYRRKEYPFPLCPIVEVCGSSVDPETFDKVKAELAGDPVDLLFIDGNHDYPIQEQDFEIYSPLVRPGGFVLIHDIINPKVWTRYWWQHTRDRFMYQEFLSGKKRGLNGLGLIWWGVPV